MQIIRANWASALSLFLPHLLFLFSGEAPCLSKALQLVGHSTARAPLVLPGGPLGNSHQVGAPWRSIRGVHRRTAAFLGAPGNAGLGPPRSAVSRSGAAARAATATSSAGSTLRDPFFPLAPPPQLSPQSAGDARDSAALDEAKEVIEKEMWRLYEEQKQQQQQGPKRLQKEQVQQLVGFSRDFCDSAKISGRLTGTECVERLLSVFQQCIACAGHLFQPFSPAQKEPFDFAEWALTLWEPLIDYANSKIEVKEETLSAISSHLEKGGNVLFLSNHQTEPDPLVARFVFRKKGFENLFQRLTAVAGYRVRSDLLSIPFSMGCNMICVHSKKHLASLTEGLEQQRKENVLAMQALQQLLQTGGSLVWVAPSGGRDRANSAGVYGQPDAFEPKTVQSFSLLARRAQDATGKETLFCPMAIYTAPICPPPKEVAKELGEARRCRFSPIGVAIGSLIRGDTRPDELTRRAQEETRALYSRIFSSDE